MISNKDLKHNMCPRGLPDKTCACSHFHPSPKKDENPNEIKKQWQQKHFATSALTFLCKMSIFISAYANSTLPVPQAKNFGFLTACFLSFFEFVIKSF